MKIPKVSVIIPLYEQNQYVSEAIESVLAQQYKNIEIILVDDGSTDFPFDIVGKYAGKIQVIRQEHSGHASANNKGLEHSTGEFIQFLDADDLISSEKIRIQIAHFFEHPDVSICYCNYVQFEESVTNKSSYLYRSSGKMTNPVIDLINFRRTYPLPIHGSLIRKSVFNEIGFLNEKLLAFEDREFFIRAASLGYVFGYDDFLGAFYRQHASNLTKNADFMFKNFITYTKILEQQLTQKALMTEEVKFLFSDSCYLFLHRYIRQSLKQKYSHILIRKIKSYQGRYCPPNCKKITRFLIKILGINLFIIILLLPMERLNKLFLKYFKKNVITNK